MTRSHAAADDWVAVDQHLAAFEAARRSGPIVDFSPFLPPRDQAIAETVLKEIIRVDMEFGWTEGHPTRLSEYRSRRPELFSDPDTLAEIAFEEFRLRRQTGDRTDPAEYERDFGVDLARWPSFVANAQGANHSTRLADPASWVGAKSDSPLEFPVVGERFAGFELLAEIGRGAFSRVFLAQQAALANRKIVLKICERSHAEPEQLAQLQHTHVVPIYSAHPLGRLQAICMPYFGATTLADVTKLVGRRDSLPASGRALLETVIARVGATVTENSASSPASVVATGTTKLSAAGEPTVTADSSSNVSDSANMLSARGPGHWSAESKLLGELSYVEAILWIIARAAEGLAHAHERGIIHQDLKPANILLSDEGRPMLLDFNLAVDVKRPFDGARRAIGGTLPYMSPEQLRSLKSGDGQGDARSDIYSLGVVLYELLTGKLPYAPQFGVLTEAAHRMAEQRREKPPRLRQANRSVTPAIEAIVDKCLAYEPSERYATARELCHDIDRHLANLPLAHAKERSLRERAVKWSRCHPRLSSGSTVVIAAATLVAALTMLLVTQQRENQRLAAREMRHQSLADIQAITLLVERPDVDSSQLAAAESLRISVADRYGLTHDDGRRRDALALLSQEEQTTLARALAEMLVQWAWSDVAAAARSSDADTRHARLEHAWRTNQLAEEVDSSVVRLDGAAGAPRFVLDQRVKLAELLGHPPEEIARSRAAAEATPPQTVRDHLFAAMQAIHEERLSDAESMLLAATRETPQDLLGWLLLGHAYFSEGRFEQAIGCYSTCLALSPRSAWIYFDRGLAYQRRGDLSLADEDYTAALRHDPKLMEAYLNRGIARLERGKPADALADFDIASELPRSPARLRFLRARALRSLGAAAAAEEALAAAIATPPTDADSWVARGMAQYYTDPRAALADFNAALEVAPRSLPALLNRASVYSERLGETERGIAALDQLLERYPGYNEAISSRAVLKARLGRCEAAVADALEALRRDGRPAIAYQVAGVYALLGRDSPDDRREALRLIERALASGYGLDLVERDPDLAPLRGDPEFEVMVERFRMVRAQRPAAAAE